MQKFKQFWFYVFTRFYNNGATYRSAGLTYVTILAMVPLFTLTLKLVSLLPIYKTLIMQVQHFFFQNFVVVKGSMLHHYLSDFAQQTKKLSIIGSIILIFGGITILVSLEQTFNHIWRVKLSYRNFQTFLYYWISILVAPALMLVAVIITSFLLSVSFMKFTIPLTSIKLLSFLPEVLTILGFAVLYYTVPNCKVKWLHALLAGVFSTCLFFISKNLLAWYLTTFSVYKLVYGTFAAIPMILIWFYVLWLITLLGAEVCYALGYRNHEK